MRRAIPGLLTVVAMLALLPYATAQDDKRPEGPRHGARPTFPNAEKIFDRLDANHDGAITSPEIPPAMPERLRQLLVAAVKKHDGRLTKADLMDIIKQHRKFRHGKDGPPMFDAKAIFARLDKDKDGSLSLEEFSAGVDRMHRMMKRPGGHHMMPHSPHMGHSFHGRSSAGGKDYSMSYCNRHGGPYCGTNVRETRHHEPAMFAYAERDGNDGPRGGRHHGHHGHHGNMGWTMQGPKHITAQVWIDRDAGPRPDGFHRRAPQDFESRLAVLERQQARVLALLEKISNRKAKEHGPRGK